jgi:phage tail-like protein
MPRDLLSWTKKDPQVVDHFSLEIQGVEEATFQQCTIGESSHDVIEHRETDKSGKQFITKQPGNLKFGDIVLKQGITESMDLYKWRQLVVDGKIAEARKNGSIVLRDSENNAIAIYSFKRGWPSKYKPADVNATTAAVAIQEVTLAVEYISRQQ